MEKQIYMTPKQPFFVTSSRSYEKFILNRFGIVHFYHCFTGTEPRYAIPDGCVDMVFCCNPKHPYAEICGTVLVATNRAFGEQHLLFRRAVSAGAIIRFWAVLTLCHIWLTTAFRWTI